MTDRLGRRSSNKRQSTGKRVRLTERDLLWLEKLNQHGPLPTSYLVEYSAALRSNEKRQKERLGDLFHEENTAHGGPYLNRPPQQFATLKAGYNQLVHDVAPAGLKALQAKGAERPRSSSSGPWVHRHMVACITASIELATLKRSDISFIPQQKILDRANAALSCPLSIIDPDTDKQTRKDLKPDALFGLSYHTPSGDRFRFFVVEADRGTEPITTRNWNRKSFVRHVTQYESYVAGGAYRDHLSLTAPLLVLNVVPDENRLRLMLKQLSEMQGTCSYQLFQTFTEFASPWKPPDPNLALLTLGWKRAELKDFSIGQD